MEYDQPQQQMYMPSYNPYASEGLLQFQVDNEEIIDTIKHSLLEESPQILPNGMVEWKNSTGNLPLINNLGMNAILGTMRSRMTKVFALSDFDDEVIEKMSISLADETIDELEENWDRYEVRDTAAASKVVSIVTDNFYGILRKAKKGLYLKFLKTSQIVQESNVFKQDQQPQNFNNFEEAKRSIPFFGSVWKGRGR